MKSVFQACSRMAMRAGSPIADSRRLAVILIILTGVMAYGGVFYVPFYYDDIQCIVINPVVKDFSLIHDLTLYRSLGIPVDIRNNMVTRFVAYLTFALNYRLHGLWLPGFHAVNVAIHLVNALLVYEFLRKILPRLLSEARERHHPAAYRGGGNPTALAVALVFVSHPVHTNAVTYVTQRFTSLAALFSLIALISYVKARDSGTAQGRQIHYATSLLATTAALFTKETSFVLPVIIALFEFLFLQGSIGTRIRRLAPYLLVMTALPVTVLYLAPSTTGIPGEGIFRGLNLVNYTHISPHDYFFTQWRVMVTYLRLLLLPIGLNFDYDYTVYTTFFHPDVISSGVLLLVILCCGVYFVCRPRFSPDSRVVMRRFAGFGILWFFVALFMESSFIPLEDVILEYRLYFPSIGFFLAAGVLLDQGIDAVVIDRKRCHVVTCILLAATVGALVAGTVIRNRLWLDEVTFWQDVVRKSPGKARPYCNLATAYARRGCIFEAIAESQKATSLAPFNGKAQYQLGMFYRQVGRYEEAIGELWRALSLRPKDAAIYEDLGKLYLLLGMGEEAGVAFDKALSIK